VRDINDGCGEIYPDFIVKLVILKVVWIFLLKPWSDPGLFCLGMHDHFWCAKNFL